MAKTKTKIELNRSGVRELLQSVEMGKICEEYAETVASKAGTGFETNARTGRNRVNARVVATDKSAKIKNRKDNVLIKALHASKGG